MLKSVFDSGVQYAFVAVGSTGNIESRKRLFFLLKHLGFTVPAILDGSSHIGSEVRFGAGSYAGKNTAVNAQSTIGDMAIINTGAVVEHGCRIRAFAHNRARRRTVRRRYSRRGHAYRRQRHGYPGGNDRGEQPS